MTHSAEIDSDILDKLPATVALNWRAAKRLGWSARIIDRGHNHLLAVSNGKETVNLLGGVSPLNSDTGSLLATDKHYSYLVLADRGLSCPRSVRCLRPGDRSIGGVTAGVEPGLQLARELGYPLIVKPNRGATGRSVCEVADDASLVKAIERVWQQDFLALVQERIALPELRLNILDGEFLIGYERKPVEVRGDGTRTLRALITALDERYGSDELWQRLIADELWQTATQQSGFAADTVLPAGARLSIGGTILTLDRWAVATMITTIPEAWQRYCRRIGAALGLRHMGIDFRGAGLDEPPQSAVIVDVNASPLLLRVVELGHQEAAIAAQMRVLCACFEPPKSTRLRVEV